MSEIEREGLQGDKCSISVVIPSYNYGHYLPEAIRSVMTQGGSWDLTIIDDGSSDDTSAVIETLSKEFPGRFNYIFQENRGLGATRNRAVDLTTGDYILYLDADDWLCDDVLAMLAQFIDQSGKPAMVICDYYSVAEGAPRLRKNHKIPASLEKRLDAYLFKKTISLASGATIIRRDVFDRIAFPEHLASSEDLPFYAGVLTGYDDVKLFHEPVVNIRIHAGRMRLDVERIEEAAPFLNEEILKRLPTSYKKWERRLNGRHFLSMSRLNFIAGNKERGRKYYWCALKSDPLALFRLSYLKKFLKNLV